MRLLHTADWHLGQTLHGRSRTREHDAFLAFLLEAIDAHDVDALVIAGDVFDVASPSSEAQAQYYRFLADAKSRRPTLDLVVVGGNHDSAARLDAPSELLDALGIPVVGGFDGADPSLADRALIPLTAGGEIAAWLVAVPFLRPRDLPTPASEDPVFDDAHARLVEGHRAVYARLFAAAETKRTEHQAIVATGHCYMTDGLVSEGSERKIQVGNQHALPAELFPPSCAYVALGHLHRAQAVGGLEHIRYSGSPIPLSLTEKGYEHQVVLVTLEGPRFVRAEPIFVPRRVAMLSVPESHQPLPFVLSRLEVLPREGPPGATDDDRPFLEVKVSLDAPYARLRREVEAALEGSWARLVRIDAKVTGEAPAPTPSRAREPLTPQDVLQACWARLHPEKPVPEALAARYYALLEDVESEA